MPCKKLLKTGKFSFIKRNCTGLHVRLIIFPDAGLETMAGLIGDLTSQAYVLLVILTSHV